MEIILVVVGLVLLMSMTTLYMYLVEDDRVEPHVPTPMKHKGNFWDAETQKYYKWNELEKLRTSKEEQNDTTQ